MSVVPGEGNVVYSDVCVRYRVREMLCTVLCVCEVQGEGNVVYSDMSLRYRVRKMLVYSDVCLR